MRCLLLFSLIFVGIGCGEFRGIPTHGGGKRFSEEQRVVAGAIRQSVADMDLAELSGKRVQIVIDGVAHDGGGNVQFPGVTYAGGSLSGTLGTGNLVQINQSLREGTGVTNDSANNGISGNTGFSVNPQTVYSTHAFASSADQQYLRAALEMKAMHAGVTLVKAEPEYLLHVLVDVLGTNRSRTENIVSSQDTLAAACEATYYAEDLRSGTLLFGARRVSAEATYKEVRAMGVGTLAVDRSIARSPVTPLPVNTDILPSTLPAIVARKKNWLEVMLTGVDD